MAEFKLTSEVASYLSLAVLLQLVCFIFPFLSPITPAISLAVLAGLRFNALTGFITGIVGFLTPAVLVGLYLPTLFLQGVLVGLTGLVAGGLRENAPAARNDLVSFSVLAVIGFEIAVQLLYGRYSIPNPLNPFYYLDNPALASAINVGACFLFAILLSHSLEEKK